MSAPTDETPEDIARLRELIAAGNGSIRAAKAMGKTRKWVLCCAQRNGIKWNSQQGSSRAMLVRPVPDDFADRAGEMIAAVLLKHYRCQWATLMRWFNETGVERLRASPGPVAKVKEPKSKPALGRMGQHAAPAIVERSRRNMSEAGQAADFLRRFGPVSRCDDMGRPSVTGQFWRRGSTVLSAGELVERAERQGFQPARWAA